LIGAALGQIALQLRGGLALVRSLVRSTAHQYTPWVSEPLVLLPDESEHPSLYAYRVPFATREFVSWLQDWFVPVAPVLRASWWSGGAGDLLDPSRLWFAPSTSKLVYGLPEWWGWAKPAIDSWYHRKDPDFMVQPQFDAFCGALQRFGGLARATSARSGTPGEEPVGSEPMASEVVHEGALSVSGDPSPVATRLIAVVYEGHEETAHLFVSPFPDRSFGAWLLASFGNVDAIIEAECFANMDLLKPADLGPRHEASPDHPADPRWLLWATSTGRALASDPR